MEQFSRTLEQRVTERTKQLDASRKAALNILAGTEDYRIQGWCLSHGITSFEVPSNGLIFMR
jgi:hypothetical protein